MKKAHLMLGIVVLFVLTQLTRFENNLVVKYDGENISADMGAEQLRFEFANASFDRISARFQNSMKGENGLKSLKISDAAGNEIFSRDRMGVYLFGRDMSRTLIRGEYKEVNTTFGDWSIDTFISSPRVLYNETLPENFSLHATFVGRGYKSLRLWGSRNVTFEIYDGLMGNRFCISKGSNEFTYCICPGSECILSPNDDREPTWWNMLRLLNFAVEIVLLALIILLLVMLLSNKRTGAHP